MNDTFPLLNSSGLIEACAARGHPKWRSAFPLLNSSGLIEAMSCLNPRSVASITFPLLNSSGLIEARMTMCPGVPYSYFRC